MTYHMHCLHTKSPNINCISRCCKVSLLNCGSSVNRFPWFWAACKTKERSSEDFSLTHSLTHSHTHSLRFLPCVARMVGISKDLLIDSAFNAFNVYLNDFGNVMLAKDVRPAKAPSPMCVTEPLMMTKTS